MHPTPVRQSDLTAKARIRNAAFAVIAEKGVTAATVRAIAEQAKVSPALVIHHFGSKQRVVDEISAWVIEFMRDNTRDADPEAGPVDAHRRRLLRFERLVAEVPMLGSYVRRMVLDGTPEGLELFKLAVDHSAADLAHREKSGIARPSADIRAESAMLFILGFAPVLLRPLLEHALEIDFEEPSARRRWREAQSELLTSALYSKDDAELGANGGR